MLYQTSPFYIDKSINSRLNRGSYLTVCITMARTAPKQCNRAPFKCTVMHLIGMNSFIFLFFKDLFFWHDFGFIESIIDYFLNQDR